MRTRELYTRLVPARETEPTCDDSISHVLRESSAPGPPARESGETESGERGAEERSVIVVVCSLPAAAPWNNVEKATDSSHIGAQPLRTS
eukprot:6813920-Prymnesium_polylepis.1